MKKQIMALVACAASLGMVGAHAAIVGSDANTPFGRMADFVHLNQRFFNQNNISVAFTPLSDVFKEVAFSANGTSKFMPGPYSYGGSYTLAGLKIALAVHDSGCWMNTGNGADKISMRCSIWPD